VFFAQHLGGTADQAIAACGGDAREAVKPLIVANALLETGARETTGIDLDWLCARPFAAARSEDMTKTIRSKKKNGPG
jgi:hypothetical protein